MQSQLLSRSPQETTFYGQAELFFSKQLAAFRRQIGCRLDLALADLPSIDERARLREILSALEERVDSLSPLPHALHGLLDQVHQAVLAPTLRERHEAFSRAHQLLIHSEPLRRASTSKLDLPDEVSDWDDVVLMCRADLNQAVQRIGDLLRAARQSRDQATKSVAYFMSRAHRWIVQAGEIL